MSEMHKLPPIIAGDHRHGQAVPETKRRFVTQGDFIYRETRYERLDGDYETVVFAPEGSHVDEHMVKDAIRCYRQRNC